MFKFVVLSYDRRWKWQQLVEQKDTLGITARSWVPINQFYSASQVMKITKIKKGAVYELCQVRKSRDTPWRDFYELMRAVCDESFTVSFESFKLMVGRLEKRRSLLLRNKKIDDIEVLLGELFCGMHTIPEPVTDSEDSVPAKERAKTEVLTAKLQHLSVRNINKRIKDVL